jgi:hypothetical protein
MPRACRDLLLRQTNPEKQIDVAVVGTDIVQSWVNIHVYNSRPVDKCLFQSRERSILLAEHRAISSRAGGQRSAVVMAFGFVILGLFFEVPRIA